MLKRNSFSGLPEMQQTVPVSKTYQDEIDIEALRAAYHAVLRASVQSEIRIGNEDLETPPPSEPLTKAYQVAVAAFADSIFTSTGLSATGLQPPPQLIPLPSPSKNQVAHLSATAGASDRNAASELPRQMPQNPVGPDMAKAARRVSGPLFDETLHRTRKQGMLPDLQPLTMPSSKIKHHSRQAKAEPNSRVVDELNANIKPAKQSPTNDTVGELFHFEKELPRVHKNSIFKKSPSPAINPVSSILDETFGLDALSPATQPITVKWLSKPKLVLGSIALCLLASAIYAGLGYWWLTSAEVSNAEPINMLQVDEPEERQDNTHTLLKNIKWLEDHNPIVLPKEKPEPLSLLAQAEPAQAITLEDIRNPMIEPTGRANPFSPLVQPNGAFMEGSSEMQPKKDLLTDLQFNGFIGDIHSKSKVAIIKLSEPASGAKTLIKRAGESFTVEGEKVFLKNVSRDYLQLTIGGQTRRLFLNPYVEVSSSGGTSEEGGNSASASPANTSSVYGQGKVSSAQSPSYATLGNLKAISGNSNLSSPVLQEP